MMAKKDLGLLPIYASFLASLFTLFPPVNVQVIDNVT